MRLFMLNLTGFFYLWSLGFGVLGATQGRLWIAAFQAVCGVAHAVMFHWWWLRPKPEPKLIKCPRCHSEGFKALLGPFPIKACWDQDGCSTLWGFWSWPAVTIARLMPWNRGGFWLLGYNSSVSYLRAMLALMRGEGR